MTETRSATHAQAQMDWVGHGESERERESLALTDGVGARQCESFHLPGGGGYLDECTPSELWQEAKFRELFDMGLPAVWLEIAHDLGYDAFMRLWRRLDAAAEMRSDAESMIEVQLRRYSSFLRFQRNRFIETLVDMGVSHREIRERVRRDIGEELSPSHIRRLAARRRVQT